MNDLLPLPPLADAGWIIGLVAVFLIFGGGGIFMEIIKNINRTRVEIAQLRAQQQASTGKSGEVAALRDEMAALREQVRELRETTMQYDLSFDTALQRMERRVEHVEQQQQQQVRT